MMRLKMEAAGRVRWLNPWPQIFLLLTCWQMRILVCTQLNYSEPSLCVDLPASWLLPLHLVEEAVPAVTVKGNWQAWWWWKRVGFYCVHCWQDWTYKVEVIGEIGQSALWFLSRYSAIIAEILCWPAKNISLGPFGALALQCTATPISVDFPCHLLQHKINQNTISIVPN